jgi:hypothetical protein
MVVVMLLVYRGWAQPLGLLLLVLLLLSVLWRDRLEGVHVQEVLDRLFVLHLIVDIAVAHERGGGGHVGSGVVLAPVPRRVVPLEVKGGGGGGWGRGVAGLREAVATSDAVDARLALGWIVNHFCELGLGRRFCRIVCMSD